MNSVRMGASLDFEYTVDHDDAEKFTIVFDLKQYPGQSNFPVADRAMTHEGAGKFSGQLTGADTDSVQAAVGQWFIIIKGSYQDERVRDEIKVYLTKKYD